VFVSAVDWRALAMLACIAAVGCTAERASPRDVSLADLDTVLAYECRLEIATNQFGVGFATYASLCVTGRDPSLRRVRDAIANGELAIDEDAMMRCFASGQHVAFEDALALGTVCASMWRPLTPLGAACDTSFACIDGYCARTDYARSRPDYVAGGCGVCVARGAPGASCEGHGWDGMNWECRPELTCDAPDGSTVGHCIATGLGDACPTHVCTEGVCSAGVCITPLPLGAACGDADECGTSADCVGHCPDGRTCEIDGTTCGTSPCVSTTCVSEGAFGDACDIDHDCLSGLTCRNGHCDMGALEGQPCAGTFCAPHLACSSSSANAVCLGSVAHGASCVATAQCPAGNACDLVCFAWIAPLGACDPSGIDRCVSGTGCVNGVCRTLPDLGEACTTGCIRGTCTRGMCTTPPVGTTCALGDPSCGADVCARGTNTCELPPTTCMGWDACPLEQFCSSAGRCASICYLGAPST
jgi:hypothetical protein